MTDELAEYFFTATMEVQYLDLLKITHPNFRQEYRIVRNYCDSNGGISVNLSDAEQDQRFTWRPIEITPLSSRDDPESEISVQLGDVGEIVAAEIEHVAEANGFLTKPELQYWAFRSDQLNAPMFGPVQLEVRDVDLNQDGAAFQAHAPFLNETATGERYEIGRFPMLRGFIS